MTTRPEAHGWLALTPDAELGGAATDATGGQAPPVGEPGPDLMRYVVEWLLSSVPELARARGQIGLCGYVVHEPALATAARRRASSIRLHLDAEYDEPTDAVALPLRTAVLFLDADPTAHLIATRNHLACDGSPMAAQLDATPRCALGALRARPALLPSELRGGWMVRPERGRVVVSDGSLLHAIHPSSGGPASRRTITWNFFGAHGVARPHQHEALPVPAAMVVPAAAAGRAAAEPAAAVRSKSDGAVSIAQTLPTHQLELSANRSSSRLRLAVKIPFTRHERALALPAVPAEELERCSVCSFVLREPVRLEFADTPWGLT